MKLAALFVGCLCLCGATVMAQEVPKDLKSLPLQQQPLPTGNLIAPVGDSSQWTVTSVFLADAAAPSTPAPKTPPPSVTTVVKSGKDYCIQTVAPDGTKTVKWKSARLQATYPPGLEKPLLAYSPGSAYYVDFSKSDFPELSWISPRNYVGVTKMGSGVAMVFQGEVPSRGRQSGVVALPPSGSVIAVIDLESRRPLLLQAGNQITSYQFNPNSGSVELPAEVKRAFDAIGKEIKQASAIPRG